MFSCEYFEIFKNTYFEEHLRTTALFLCYCFASKIVRAKDTVDFKLYHESVDTTHLLTFNAVRVFKGTLMHI